jgi:hypothetical protein
MKKTLAILLVAGSLAAAGLSAGAAVSASGSSTGQESVAVGWWPNATPQGSIDAASRAGTTKVGWWPNDKSSV